MVFCLRVETSSSGNKQTIMATNQIIFFLMLFICSCSSASSLTKTTSPSVAHLQENTAGSIGEKSKLSGGGKGGMSNGGQSGQPDGSNSQNPHGSSAVIPIYAANAHHNTHRNAATRPHNNPTPFPPLFSVTLLAFLV